MWGYKCSEWNTAQVHDVEKWIRSGQEGSAQASPRSDDQAEAGEQQ